MDSHLIPLIRPSKPSVNNKPKPIINDGIKEIRTDTWVLCGLEIVDKLSFVGIVSSIALAIASITMGAVGLAIAIQNGNEIDRLDARVGAYEPLMSY